MVTYRVMVLVGLIVWHGGTYTADPVKVSLDDECFLTFLIHNKSEVDVEVWVTREVHYRRPDKTTFTTMARSARTCVRSGQNRTMVSYLPAWKQKSSDQRHNASDLKVCGLTCRLSGHTVQKTDTGEFSIVRERDGKTLTIEPSSRGNEHNSCTE